MYCIITEVILVNKSKKYDIVIYLSLFIALVCLGISALDYTHSSKTESLIEDKSVDEIPEPIPSEIETKESDIKQEEPEYLLEVDKKGTIKKYLDQIIDQAVKDDVITHKMMKTWGKYEVISTTYVREIVSGYYEYIADIKIEKLDATLPCSKNNELSTENYNVITLTINILRSGMHNGYIVKSITPPTEENK